MDFEVEVTHITYKKDKLEYRQKWIARMLISLYFSSTACLLCSTQMV